MEKDTPRLKGSLGQHEQWGTFGVAEYRELLIGEARGAVAVSMERQKMSEDRDGTGHLKDELHDHWNTQGVSRLSGSTESPPNKCKSVFPEMERDLREKDTRRNKDSISGHPAFSPSPYRDSKRLGCDHQQSAGLATTRRHRSRSS